MALINNFETIYKELENLLINRFPENIQKINKEHNDGIIIKPFENKSLEENCIKTPSFSFNLEETEYEEKDRIVEYTIYTINLEIKLPPNIENNTLFFLRYVEAFQKMFNTEESNCLFKIQQTKKYKLRLKIYENY